MHIQSIESIAVRIPRDLESATGTAGSPNQLAGNGDYRWSRDYPVLYSIHFETALVKVTLDNGLTGWGEAQAPLAPEVACAIVDRLLRPALEGEEFDGTRDRIEALWQRMYSTMRVRGQTGGFMLDAISGVDIALWDLAGKIHNVPVSALLSPSPRSHVPAYLSGLSGATVSEKLETARAAWNDGFRIFKLYYESDWNGILEQIDILRAEFGPECRVAVDALWHLDPAQAAEMAGELDGRGALWLECPLMPEDASGHLALARSTRTPIAIGESYRTGGELTPFLDAAGILQPDLGRSGITECMRIADLARTRNCSIVPHLSIALGPQIGAAVHFAAAAPNCELCEYNPRVVEVANRFLSQPFRLDGNKWITPQDPGLGIALQESAIRQYEI